VLGWLWRLTTCFWCLQAVVLSEDASNAIESAVEAILREYKKKLKTGDADDVATLVSLAAAIGLASKLDLGDCKKLVKSGPFRAVAFTRGTAWRWQVV
jgi:hypothetical protein